MDFVANRGELQEMLQAIGVSSIDELFSSIPKTLRQDPPPGDDGLSEYEGMRLAETVGNKNSFPAFDNYLGGGSYEHHIPPLVASLTQRGEFLTAYTPYQAEASQGMLQAIFEFQSALCALTGLDVANASLYDGASAAAEACLMACRLRKERQTIVVAETVNPLYRAVVTSYLEALDIDLVTVPCTKEGLIDLEVLRRIVNEKTIALLLQSPNFLGVIDRISEAAAVAKEAGALTILSADPLAYGLFRSAGEMGVDIAVGDCQPFGMPMLFGGPYAGYICCRQGLERQMPGRIVGETVDTQGRRGFVLTMQAREQHIRREKATSNICTNQSLAALSALIAMLWYGKEGIRELALANYQRTAFLKEALQKISGVTVLHGAPHFNEIAVKFPVPLERVLHHFRSHRIEPGLDLGRFSNRWADYLLVAVTETKTEEQLTRYIGVAKEVCA